LLTIALCILAMRFDICQPGEEVVRRRGYRHVHAIWRSYLADLVVENSDKYRLLTSTNSQAILDGLESSPTVGHELEESAYERPAVV
jgi:hypothetical protein